MNRVDTGRDRAEPTAVRPVRLVAPAVTTATAGRASSIDVPSARKTAQRSAQITVHALAGHVV
ncbi:hypothetical protein [Streptomyces sp. NBC_00316]|uniref:hypothetical protein n=1 Tax=Streptomyces sp. NBC_00316 TaxID=2975710 RepID=UPI002E28E8C4|nr:hypothetical protein [Streptomyces sp. NBC_00316]